MRAQIFLPFCLLLCTQTDWARGATDWARFRRIMRERQEQGIRERQAIAERFAPRKPPKPVYKANPYGQVQYLSYSRPRHSYGSYSAEGSSYGYRAPGYGTSWGTSFPAGKGRYKGELSGKALGLGVGPGFLGGSAGARLGVAATMATYAVYHRYYRHQKLKYNHNDVDLDENHYYANYYSRNLCLNGCPPDSHCEWGFCECNYLLFKSSGKCSSIPPAPRASTYSVSMFDVACRDSYSYRENSTARSVYRTSTETTCSVYDINMVCNTSLNKCECRRDMRWNSKAGECQIYLNVNCSALTYSTPPSAPILSAAKQTQAELAGFMTNQAPNTTNGMMRKVHLFLALATMLHCNRTQTKEESLATSLLGQIDPQTVSAEQIDEAFCRDIDVFSFEFQERKEERPSQLCQPVPESACAVAYDSGQCSGGWNLVLPPLQQHEGLNFRYWSSYWKYRNDMDLIGVRAGCTFTGFSDSNFSGRNVTVRGERWDRWVVFAREPEYQHMDEDIESIKCSCN